MQEASINANYAQREIVQEEQIQQQQPLEQYDEQKNYEIGLQNINYQDNNNYNEIVDTNAISQTNFVNASTPIPTPNINISTTSNAQPITHTVVHPTITTTNFQQPIVFKDADELNKYFESIGTNAYNQVVSSLNNTSTNVNEVSNVNLNNMNININTNTNEEDLNKYFQPNAYTQNDNNFDLANMGLQTSTTLQGATSEEEINKYFQGAGTTYNTGNVEVNQYQYGTNSQTQNTGSVNFSEYKATSSKQSYNYNY